MIIFDIETNGFLQKLNKIHMLAYNNLKTKKKQLLKGHKAIKEWLSTLTEEDTLVGHNVIGFDLPALQKVFNWQHKGKVIDTLVLSRLIYSELLEDDAKLSAKGKLPKKLMGSHSLEAWGYRLGNYKGDFAGPWSVEEYISDQRLQGNIEDTDDVLETIYWDTMGEYCEQDVEVTTALYNKLSKIEYSSVAIELEHQVQWIIQRQIRYGVTFDIDAGLRLYNTLVCKRDILVDELIALFGSWYEQDGPVFTPKRDNKASGYTEGVPLTKIKMVTFNPGSRQHIAKRLIKDYGWKPTSFTETGIPEVNEKVLSELKHLFPVSKLLEYLLLDKRIGQLSDGDNGWIKRVTPEGRIHGNVNTNGAVTGRMTHSSPNLAQVPKVGSPYGFECRSLFTVPKGKVMVGCDASGLEGRTLSHYASKYDGGKYAKILLEGDVHWENTLALGLVPAGTKRQKEESDPLYKEHKSYRDTAKTWFYAWLYGAGDKKLAVTLGCSESRAKTLRALFLKNAGALGALQADVAKAVSERGYLKAIDGRILKIRSEHSALNTLLQSCGAIVMKKALVILDENLQKSGLTPGVDYEFLLNIHDEWQIETEERLGETIASQAVEAIRQAGVFFNMRIPMEGDARIGRNWAETH